MPCRQLLFQIVFHAFYAVLHQWYIPVKEESEFKIGKFKLRVGIQVILRDLGAEHALLYF